MKTKLSIPLSSQKSQFERPQRRIARRGKGEAQLESDVASIRGLARVNGDRPDPPDLAHADDHAGDTKAESADSGKARG